MNNPTPRFTGIFIPAEILELEELSLFEMLLLSWIDALYCPERRGCFASNAYLGTKIRNAKENTVAKAITTLRRLGLIEDISFDGRTRVIRALINQHVHKTQSCKGLDKNPTGVGQTSNAGCDIYPSSPYIESKGYIKEREGREGGTPTPPLFKKHIQIQEQALEENGGTSKLSSVAVLEREDHPTFRLGKHIQMPNKDYEELVREFGKNVIQEHLEAMDRWLEENQETRDDHASWARHWISNEWKKRKEGVDLQENKVYAKKIAANFNLVVGPNRQVELKAGREGLEIYSICATGIVQPTVIKYSAAGFKGKVDKALIKWGLK